MRLAEPLADDATIAMFAEPNFMTNSPKPGVTGLKRESLLRDSDPFEGAITKKAQANYCVAFQTTVSKNQIK